MTDNVRALPGHHVPPVDVNQPLVEALRTVLAMAESGQLQSYVGTGFTADNLRVSTWATDRQRDVYQLLGSLAWLEHEYVARIVRDRQ